MRLGQPVAGPHTADHNQPANPVKNAPPATNLYSAVHLVPRPSILSQEAFATGPPSLPCPLNQG